jgi:hypothetical protein
MFVYNFIFWVKCKEGLEWVIIKHNSYTTKLIVIFQIPHLTNKSIKLKSPKQALSKLCTNIFFLVCMVTKHPYVWVKEKSYQFILFGKKKKKKYFPHLTIRLSKFPILSIK